MMRRTLSSMLLGLASLTLSIAAHAQIPPTQEPFSIQYPPGITQSGQIPPAVPGGTVTNSVMPPGVPGTGTSSNALPMALPPSSGGYVPSQQQQSPSNPYGGIPYPTPASQPTPSGQTKSEIVPFNPAPEWKPTVIVKTSEGEFKIQLNPVLAANNVKNFLDLALGQKEFIDNRTGKKVRRPFYTGLNCHKVIKGFIIQCGCPFGTGRGGPGYKVADEIKPPSRFDRPGVVAMAPMRERNGNGPGYDRDSNGSQFFISLAPLPEFNEKFTVIGTITSGMDTIRKIASTPTGPTDRPIKRVIIFSVDPDLPPASSSAPAQDPMAPATGGPGSYDPFAAPPPPPPDAPALPLAPAPPAH